ncbi:sensor histidine kinase [Paenibacillus chungangensis]|uniref:histidine kinase n=1 Tax=Paenibacillus chungangensis TaxID=696535 RepID=A0ABW3HS24_9BACL
MKTTGKGLSLILFLKDRLLYMGLIIVIIGLATSLFLLETARHPGLVETGTMVYFVLLALFMLGVWLVLDYVRQRHYYNELKEAIIKSDELQASMMIGAAVTSEQQLVVKLLEEQHRAYLNELGRYRRQQEMHNHYVMQWVHHMKTPISVIDLHMQEAQGSSAIGEAELGELARSVREETERMTRGLEMMLHTARLEKFELDVHIRRKPLHDLIRASVNAHKRLCIQYAIYPRIQGEAWVETDEKWMIFVMNQLTSNAIKYSKSKPGSKKLIYRITEHAGGEVVLAIIDEGIGIPKQELSRIFDAFFTGENGRTSGESTGMGLYLTKQVCMKLGHAISVSSEPGTGTTFSLSFKPAGIHVMSE